jgi:hypothetical protein
MAAANEGDDLSAEAFVLAIGVALEKGIALAIPDIDMMSPSIRAIKGYRARLCRAAHYPSPIFEPAMASNC